MPTTTATFCPPCPPSQHGPTESSQPTQVPNPGHDRSVSRLPSIYSRRQTSAYVPIAPTGTILHSQNIMNNPNDAKVDVWPESRQSAEGIPGVREEEGAHGMSEGICLQIRRSGASKTSNVKREKLVRKVEKWRNDVFLAIKTEEALEKYRRPRRIRS